MERTRFSTWLLILGAAFCSMAFDTDDDDFVFYLSTDRTFVPGNPVNVYLNGRFSKSVAMEFELYRVNDPVDFFNEHCP